MSASRYAREWARSARARALCLLLGWAAPAHAASAAYAELTALFDSGNLLRGPAALAPPWEDLASPRSGQENRARLALVRQDLGFLPGVTTLTALRLELGLDALGQGGVPALHDASSFIGLGFRLGADARLELRAFPFDTDYLRVGYLHALDWGGTDVGRRESVFLQQTGGAPGAELSLRARQVRLFAGVKCANVPDLLSGQRRLWGALWGGSFELTKPFSLDAGFGYFQRPGPGSSSFVEGASLRLVWHHGVREPELVAEPFRATSFREDPERLGAPEIPGFALALEAVTLVGAGRRLEAPNQGSLSAAPAAGLYGSVRGRWLALHAAFSWRSLAFVRCNDLRAQAGDTELRATALPELAAWLGASVVNAPFHLVPSVELGARLPAALQMQSALPGFTQTLVVGAPSGLEALPIGAGRLPTLTTRLALRFQASPSLALSLFGEYSRDPNRTSFVASPAGVTRSFAPPDSLSALTAVQARF